MQRRDFLGRCLMAPLVLPMTTSLALAKKGSKKVAYLAAAQSTLGEHSIIGVSKNGQSLIEHSIPSRGHSFASTSNGVTAVIARRPADFCLILDEQARFVIEIQALENRHFYGHGVYDPTGEFLYLTENDFANNRGVIGVYQASKSYQRVAEYESYGIGPHEITLNADASQLVVANGGIETHPASGRKKLNLPTMQPSLAFIDRQNGELLSSAKLSAEQHSNSIRHIAVSSDNSVYLAMQNQDKSKPEVLLARAEIGKTTITTLDIPQAMKSLLDSYVGDIALDQSKQFLAASSPSGNTLLVHYLSGGQTVSQTISDVCAVTETSEAGEFIASSGDGRLFRLSCNVNSINRLEVEQSDIADFGGQQHWDNHLSVLI